MDTTNKSQTVKASELLSTYCHATGYFPDECVGASDEELRAALVEMGYTVEELPVKVKAEPWELTPADDEARTMFPGFWA